MLVHRADTGGYYEVDVTSDASVELLKEILAKLSGIPPNDQILLCDYVKLDRGQKLQRYGLPSQEKGVFLFDRRSLEPNSPLPGEVVFPQVEIQTYMQPAPPLPASDELKSSPLVWAIIKLEHEFFSDLNTAQALKQVIDARLNICKECVMEQENQTKALEAALANLRDQYSQLVQLYNQFKPSYNVLYDRHRSLLQSFESDLQKLRDTKLHSSLIRENQFSLIDIVPEGRLRKWAEDCRNEHEQLTQRVTDLENQVMIVKELVDSESRKKPEVDFKSLHVQLQKASDISQEVSGKVQLFVTDYQDVKRKKEQANKKDPKELADMCEDLNETKRKHQQVLQNMVKYDDTMKQIMSMCAASKTTLTRGMHERLRSSATLQSKIREYLNKVVVYHEALTKQRTAFQQLVYVQTMPKAYQAALDEVVRRRRFSRKISALNTKLMDYMNKLRQEEAEKRKIFLDSFGRFIPRELIPGLSEALPQFELVVPQFDASLPPIEPESNAPIEDDFTLLLSGEDKSSRVHDLEAENQKLQSEIKSLQWNLESSRNAFADLKDSELYRLKTDLLQSQESASDYKKRIEMLENKLSTTYSQIEQVESLMKEYKNKYEVAESEIEKLQKEASQLFTSQQTNQNLEQSLKETQEQVEQLMGKMKQVGDEKEALSNQLKEEEEERFKLYAEMKSLTKKLDLLKADYDDVMDQMKQLQKEKEDLLVIVETTSKDTEALLKEKSNVTQRQTELEEQITELEMLKDALEKERDNLAEEVEDQKSTIQQLQEELQDLENQIAVEKEDKRIQLEGSKQSNEQIAKLESKLGKLKLENRSIQQKLESTTQALSEAMDQIKQLNISLAERDEELSKTLESSTLDNKQHKKRADELSHKVKDLESQMEKDKRKMDDMQASVELYKARANKIEDEKRQLNDQLTTAYKNASKAEEEKVQLSRQLQSLSKIESEKKLLDKEKQSLLEELASSKEKLKVRDQELMEKIKALEKQLVDLQKASGNGSGSNAALGELEKQLADRENSYRQLTQKYIDAVKIIESKNKQNVDIMRNATIQENKLKEAMEKVTPLQVEMEKTKSVLQDVVNALPRDKTFKLDNNNWLASFQAGIRNLVEDYLKLDNEQNNIKGHLKAVELNHEHQLEEMKKKYQELQGELAVLQMEMENRDTKLNLAFNNFKAGDYAMFLPDKNGHYQAVNNKSPNYFLSPFVLEHFSDQSKEKAPIFGQIIEIQENTSSAQSNPFHLSHGTKYYEVVISKL